MTILVKVFAIEKQLLILLTVEEIVNWELFTLSGTCFIKANLGETLSSRTHTLFSSNLTVTWCKSARLVHSWVSDWSWVVGIETQLLYPTVIYWMACRLEQTNDHVTVQTADQFPEGFVSPTPWNSHNFWTKNTQKVSTVQLFQSFSRKSKFFSFRLARKSLTGSSANV